MCSLQRDKAEVLALIPARGGSKGIPRKNVMPIAGRPLIAHSIHQALQSRLITRVVVSTDDAEIAEVARAWGAEVPFMRPIAYAQDLSPDIDVIHHALQVLDESEHYMPELVVHLRPTEPVRRVKRIDEAIDLMLKDQSSDSLRSVCQPSQTPYKMWRIDNGYLKPLLSVDGVAEAHSMPRQVLPVVYEHNGYIDIIRPATILIQQSMVGQRVLPFVMDEPRYDLDYPSDIARVEAALYALTNNEWLADAS